MVVGRDKKHQMDCPNCGEARQSSVMETRSEPASVRRRRKCEKCKYRFTTREWVIGDEPEDGESVECMLKQIIAIKQAYLNNMRRLTKELVRQVDCYRVTFPEEAIHELGGDPEDGGDPGAAGEEGSSGSCRAAALGNQTDPDRS